MCSERTFDLFKSLKKIIICAPLPLLFVASCSSPSSDHNRFDEDSISVKARQKEILEEDGISYRDLNGDGGLNTYEDWRLTPDERALDLVRRMTLEEKVGAMMHSTLPGKGPGAPWAGTSYDFELYGKLLKGKHITHYITRLSFSPEKLAEQHNRIQEIAEGTRLGIPVTISTDPRSHFQHVLGASAETVAFSQWPEPLGFAALNDVERVKTFGDIVRREYRAVGIHMALSPQADLATEPRWPRQLATFGSRAELTSKLARAYVEGFQGGDEGVTSEGVMTVTKHWVGYGAAPNGFDGHNYYGRFVTLEEAHLREHVKAFEGPIQARTAGIMPTYSVLNDVAWKGDQIEAVGGGFNVQLLKGMLRGEFGYDGVLLSDWGVVNDCAKRCSSPTEDAPQTPEFIASPWGVEDLTRYERYVKGVDAGLDQFGGSEEVIHLIQAVEKGDLSERRLDESVFRIMRGKFKLGLFDNPYVDPKEAARLVGSQKFVELASQTQREAQVLLKNENGFMPTGSSGKKVYLFGISTQAAIAKGLEVVSDAEEADFAIVRADTPSEVLHPNHFFGSRQDEGRLNFQSGDPAYEVIKDLSGKMPIILSIFLDRPAVLTDVQSEVTAILANFGASDEAVIDVIVGNAEAIGRLPFELPASMSAVESQHPGAADDSEDPLYPFGYGL